MNRAHTIFLCVSIFGVGGAGADLYTMAGSVIDAQSGKGIARARVTVEMHVSDTKPSSFLVALTDESGDFSFRNLTQSTGRIWAEKPGYLGGSNRKEATMNWVFSATGPIVFSMVREAVIEGEIVDEAGGGVRGQVLLWRRSPENGHIEAVNSGVSVAPSDEFRFFGLEAGTYFVQVSNVFGPVNMTYPTVLYPHAPDLDSAKPIHLEPGQNQHLEFVLKQVHAYKIRGRYTGGADNPSISFHLPGLPSGSNSVSADSKSRTFEIARVAPGTYVLDITSWSTDSKVSKATLSVTVDARDIDGLDVTLIPAPAATPSLR